jgi:hypothetical protein
VFSREVLRRERQRNADQAQQRERRRQLRLALGVPSRKKLGDLASTAVSGAYPPPAKKLPGRAARPACPGSTLDLNRLKSA